MRGKFWPRLNLWSRFSDLKMRAGDKQVGYMYLYGETTNCPRFLANSGNMMIFASR